MGKQTGKLAAKLTTGDRCVRVGFPLEIGDVIGSHQFTVEVRWPGGTVEEIDRAQLRRAGDPLPAKFDGVLRDIEEGKEGPNFPTVKGYQGFSLGKKYKAHGYPAESEE